MTKDECELLDLAEVRGRYRFTWGRGGDWADKLGAVKRLFRPHQRNYDPEARTWDVLACGRSEEMLCAIFPNARRAFLVLRSQTNFLDMVDEQEVSV